MSSYSRLIEARLMPFDTLDQFELISKKYPIVYKLQREEFPETMYQLIIWQQWIDLIKELYPSGAAIEESIYDSYAIR